MLTMERMTSLSAGQIPPQVTIPAVTLWDLKKSVERGPATSRELSVGSCDGGRSGIKETTGSADLTVHGPRDGIDHESSATATS